MLISGKRSIPDMKTGLVVEGGGMKCAYSAGILDRFLDEHITFDYCISTMPIKDLFNAFSFTIPSDIKYISDNLVYRDFITVGILLDKTKIELNDNWIYIQESYVKVGRIQVFNNWSPFLVSNAETTWLGLEYFCNESDSLWKLKEEELKKQQESQEQPEGPDSATEESEQEEPQKEESGITDEQLKKKRQLQVRIGKEVGACVCGDAGSLLSGPGRRRGQVF